MLINMESNIIQLTVFVFCWYKTEQSLCLFDYLTTPYQRELKEILKTVFCQHVLKEIVNWSSALEVPRNTQTSDVACSLKFSRLNYGTGTFNKNLPFPIWPGNHSKASLFTTRKVSRNLYKELAALCAISRQPWKQPKRLSLSLSANYTVIHFQVQYLIFGLGYVWSKLQQTGHRITISRMTGFELVG